MATELPSEDKSKEDFAVLIAEWFERIGYNDNKIIIEHFLNKNKIPQLKRSPCQHENIPGEACKPAVKLTKKQLHKLKQMQKALEGLERVSKFISKEMYEFKKTEIFEKFKI
jgi:hypothetical protein